MPGKKNLILFTGCLTAAVIFFVFVVLPAFSGTHPVSPDYFFGPIRIHIYSWILIAAVVSGFFATKKLTINKGIEIRHVENLAVINVLSGLVGARFYHVITAWDYYSDNFYQIFAIWKGGLGIFGGLAFGLIATYVYAKANKINFLSLADLFAPGICLALALGRWGNFFNYEIYGTPTLLPWKMFVPFSSRLSTFVEEMYFHPLFLYEFLGLMFLFFILQRTAKMQTAFAGYTFALFLIIYAIEKILLEYLKINTSVLTGEVNRVAYLIALLLGVLILSLGGRQRRLQNV